MTQTKKHRWLGASVLALAIGGLVAPAYWRAGPGDGVAEAQTREPRTREAQTRRDVDPEADRILREMSEQLAGMESFRVSADSVFEVVLQNGQKLQFLATSQVAVRRPDRLRSERTGPMAELTLYYDGDSITLHGRQANLYATIDAPRTLDEAVDFARNELDIEAPGADLLGSDVYATLMEDVRSGTYVGQEDIGGVATHHLAFRNRGRTDWQIWVQDGATPVPVRYVIVSNDVRSQPEFVVSLHDWDTQATVSEAEFTFEAPEGARQIEFRQAAEMREGARAGRGLRAPRGE